MIKCLFGCLLTLTVSSAFAQINLEDSTAQVVAYWSVGDTQEYSVSLKKIKLDGADTIENTLTTYDVAITVIDSASSYYLIEWFYKNYKVNTSNVLENEIAAISEDIKVLIETDEFGAIKGVKNWEEVGSYIKKSTQRIGQKYGENDQIQQVLAQAEQAFTSKQGIESAAIQDAQQFHTYHGGKYKLVQVVQGTVQVPNMLGQNGLLDCDVTVSLDKLEPEEGSFIIRFTQEVNSEQLTEMIFAYMKSVSEIMKNPLPSMEEIGLVTNNTSIASRIHESGWVIYSIQTKVVQAQHSTTIEERIIEIK